MELRGFMQRYRQEIAAEHSGEETHVLLALHHVSHAWMVEHARMRKTCCNLMHACKQERNLMALIHDHINA
jgi:hypothetical protein